MPPTLTLCFLAVLSFLFYHWDPLPSSINKTADDDIFFLLIDSAGNLWECPVQLIALLMAIAQSSRQWAAHIQRYCQVIATDNIFHSMLHHSFANLPLVYSTEEVTFFTFWWCYFLLAALCCPFQFDNATIQQRGLQFKLSLTRAFSKSTVGRQLILIGSCWTNILTLLVFGADGNFWWQTVAMLFVRPLFPFTYPLL